MARLTDRVALIGGPDAGPLGDEDDCNVYAISTSSGTVVVDAGVGRSIDHIVETATADGVDLDEVAAVLLTHAHLDHGGGAHLLRERLAAPVVASHETARRLAEADEASISLPEARRCGMYRPTDVLRACATDRVVGDLERLEFGDAVFVVLATPGHAADHVSFLLEIDGWVALISGDLLFPGGLVALLNTHDCSVQELAASLERLRDLPFDALLAGHLAPALADAQLDRDEALARLDALVLPRSMV